MSSEFDRSSIPPELAFDIIGVKAILRETTDVVDFRENLEVIATRYARGINVPSFGDPLQTFLESARGVEKLQALLLEGYPLTDKSSSLVRFYAFTNSIKELLDPLSMAHERLRGENIQAPVSISLNFVDTRGSTDQIELLRAFSKECKEIDQSEITPTVSVFLTRE